MGAEDYCDFRHFMHGTAARPNESDNLLPMQSLVQDRVQKLRQEIADISAANHAYIIKNSKDSAAAGEQERRLQRLKEIMDELRALTDWKET